jgi:outer membrane protein insertion porin family
MLNTDWSYTKGRMEFSIYRRLFHPKHILAFRLWAQHVQGEAPYLELSQIGDGWTARGYKAGRFLDNAMALTSVEYRFPIYRKLGGVLFADAGRVRPDIWKFNFRDWHCNVGWGLRYYLANFVTRFDMGISREGTRIFFNFGHVF